MLDDNKAQMEMDLIMNEQKDPVSGNTAPIGAKPSEVRDDIDIRVSENEFVVNAQTVRYFGEEFFNELQEAAAQGFERIKEGDELPFRDDELDVDETEDQEVEPEGFAYGGAVKGYAEGDVVVPQPVGGGYGGYGGTGALFGGFQSKTYINPETNQKMIVFFFNGRPMKRIPAGFVEMAATPAEQQAVATQASRDSNDDNYADEILSEIKASGTDWRNKDVESWSDDEYASYYSQLDSNVKKGNSPLDLDEGEKLVTTLLGGPYGILGKVLGVDSAVESLIKKQKLERAEGIFNHIASLEETDPVKNDTRYILGSVLGKEGYDPTVGNPYKTFEYKEGDYTSLKAGDELDIYGMPTEKARVDRGMSATSILDMSKINTLEEYYEAGGVRPRARPPTLETGGFGVEAPKGKYDPTSTTAAGGFKNNVLSKAEQDAFDNAVDSGDSAAANHYVSVNRLRNKQNSFIDGGMTRAEGAAMGLSSWDMDQAEKFGGSVERATTSEEEGGLGTHAKQKNPLAPAREKSDDDTADDTSGDKILCDLIYRYGYLDEDIWRLDEAFGDRVALEDPELLEGYHTWAKPMVAWIEKETFLSNLYLKYWCVPFTRRWANHIAHVMEPEKYKPDYVGKLMLAVGVPISRAIYKLKGRKLKTV